MSTRSAPPPIKLIAAFGAVYVIWGSTYLAIRFAVETLPPFSMAGARFLIAGVVLYLWARYVSRAPSPTVREWRSTAVVGAFLLLGGNGAVVWAEQYVASGLAALLIATLPLWMVLLDWLFGGDRPTLPLVLGVALGMAGVALLVAGEDLAGSGPLALAGAFAVLAGAFLWAFGSIYSRRAPLPASPLLGSAMQMVVGGVLLFIAGAAAGEWNHLDATTFSQRSVMALLYLIVFGSLIAYSAYVWLLTATTAARVSTYAYVNPVVALFLGWALASEPISPRTILAATVILTSVIIITRASAGRPALVRASETLE